MKSTNETDFDQLPSDLMLKINQLCDRFESELRHGDLPSINAYLDDVAVEYREVILKELIPLEVEHRCQQGEPPEAGEYLNAFPILDQEWLYELIGSARATSKLSEINSAHSNRASDFRDVSLEQLSQRIIDAGILSPEDLRTQQKIESHSTATAFSRQLFQSGILTEYQSHALLEAEPRPLLIGDYLILEPIGSGGMGTVYKAMHQRMKRIVALKVIRSDLGDQLPEYLKRFEREVQTAARLSHPNIVTAYDAGEFAGEHYLICEYIDGESLTQMVRDSGPLDFPDALNCIIQVAQGLEYAHGKGVIHRDIKPANILIDDQGDLKILDMGLARLQENEDILGSGGETELTTSQFFMGTIDYMAPEQARNTKHADHRSDIYSLGCTLYFLLTAKPVFGGGTTVERILAHKEQPIPRLSKLLPQVPAEFDALFEKMLAKDPGDRYQSATDLLAELNQFNEDALQDQTFHLPAKEVNVTEPAKDNWASAPTQVQPVPELTTMASATVSTSPQTHTKKKPGLLWIGVAGVALLLGAAVIWNPFGKKESPSQTSLSQEAPETPAVPTVGTDAQSAQSSYAQKWDLPINQKVSLSTSGPELELALIPPGQFKMGDAAGADANYDAIAHPVKITQPYYMGTTEITNAQYRQFVEATQYKTDAERIGGFGMVGGGWGKSNTYYWNNLGDLPVQPQAPAVNISWNDAVAFCEWLSKKTGDTYRLPTEAEWEYACRAGTKGPWFFGDRASDLEQYAWFLNNSVGRVYPVKQKQPNPFGLYDLYGNEWEWCQDYYADDYYGHSPLENPTGPTEGRERVQRGGGFQQGGDKLNSFIRGRNAPNSPSHGAFRIVREVKK